MKSAIAILTYRRLPALQEMLKGIDQHCAGYPVAIFEDCGMRDGTDKFLREGRFLKGPRDDLMATEYIGDGHWPGGAAQATAFIGTRNLGVSGNSNRALKWFMDGGWDHLCLCNDDLHVLGDFVNFYAKAHADLGQGLFCFNDFTDPRHRWIIARSRGYRLKVFPMMTGIMMSVLRRTVSKVGYFDTRFGRFGEEHCDWTNRIRFLKEMQLDGADQVCLDVEPTLPNGEAGPPVLRHQEVETSIQGEERKREDAIAAVRIREAAQRYALNNHYRPFTLAWPSHVGGVGDRGIKTEDIPRYQQVTCS